MRRFRFPEPCGHPGHQPSPKHVHGAVVERSASVDFRRAGAAEVSELRIQGHRHDIEDAIRGELLAVHPVRRRLEYDAHAGGRPRYASMVMTSANVVRDLRELIAALDRRVPQVQRAGEVSIARDAAALRARALKRLEELEGAGDDEV